MDELQFLKNGNFHVTQLAESYSQGRCTFSYIPSIHSITVLHTHACGRDFFYKTRQLSFLNGNFFLLAYPNSYLLYCYYLL